ncbi:MAG TPA: NAD(P)-binding domain-containing protein, partial [Burkholderiales bacterium]|nr:NAD(P)-binding domain-containing protein [Burkholderiales bacterium]
MKRIAVLGAGAWGTSIAAVLAARVEVVLWARNPAQAEGLARTRRNERYLPGIEIPSAVRVSSNLADAAGAELVLAATPVSGLRDVVKKIGKQA